MMNWLIPAPGWQKRLALCAPAFLLLFTAMWLLVDELIVLIGQLVKGAV